MQITVECAVWARKFSRHYVQDRAPRVLSLAALRIAPPAQCRLQKAPVRLHAEHIRRYHILRREPGTDEGLEAFVKRSIFARP
jgi:hypothetical protein